MRNWPAAAIVIVLLAAAAGTAFWFTPPAWAFGAAFVVVFLVYTNTAVERVPLYLSNAHTCRAVGREMDDFAVPATRRPVFVDLGCGTGTMVSAIARTHPDWDVLGVETAPIPYAIAAARTWRQGNARVRYQSLWRLDFGDFDVLYAFLSPAPMGRLLDKARAEMAPGAVLISNSFWTDTVEPDAHLVLPDRRATHLFKFYGRKAA